MLRATSTTDGTRRSLVNHRAFQYACIVSGLLCPLFFFGGFIGAGFIPPLKPSKSAEQVAHHYQRHEHGVRAGASLILMSGALYLPYTALITTQIDRISHAPKGLGYLQLTAGGGNLFTFLVPAMILALAGYRVDRDPQATQILNDAFWIFAVMPFTSFIPQNWAFAYAILCEHHRKPLFPRYVGYINFLAPIFFSTAIGLHCVKSGPIAWDGALTFWTGAVAFGIQFGIDSLSLFNAVRRDDYEFEDLSDDHVNRTVTSVALSQGGSDGKDL